MAKQSIERTAAAWLRRRLGGSCVSSASASGKLTAEPGGIAASSASHHHECMQYPYNLHAFFSGNSARVAANAAHCICFDAVKRQKGVSTLRQQQQRCVAWSMLHVACWNSECSTMDVACCRGWTLDIGRRQQLQLQQATTTAMMTPPAVKSFARRGDSCEICRQAFEFRIMHASLPSGRRTVGPGAFLFAQRMLK